MQLNLQEKEAARGSLQSNPVPVCVALTHLVGECLKERWQCQRLRAHVDSDTLWITNPTQVFTEFLTDGNAESLQLHFLRR